MHGGVCTGCYIKGEEEEMRGTCRTETDPEDEARSETDPEDSFLCGGHFRPGEVYKKTHLCTGGNFNR